jgi:hypothetical protein
MRPHWESDIVGEITWKGEEYKNPLNNKAKRYFEIEYEDNFTHKAVPLQCVIPKVAVAENAVDYYEELKRLSVGSQVNISVKMGVREKKSKDGKPYNELIAYVGRLDPSSLMIPHVVNTEPEIPEPVKRDKELEVEEDVPF